MVRLHVFLISSLEKKVINDFFIVSVMIIKFYFLLDVEPCKSSLPMYQARRRHMRDETKAVCVPTSTKIKRVGVDSIKFSSVFPTTNIQ